MRVALISDELTRRSLENECRVINVTPWNYRWALKWMCPDIFFVESAWQGYLGSWKYRIASYPENPRRHNGDLGRVVEYARSLNIPTVFWNKEDGVHFSRFISSAIFFDNVLTVDINCIPLYKKHLPKTSKVDTMLFAAQNATHFFDGFRFTKNCANFVGSYSSHLHHDRRRWQNMMFDSCEKLGICVNVFDRNSDRRSDQYRFPESESIRLHKSVSHEKTAEVFRNHIISLNVNTVTDSPTMFSRRLVEILACGGIALTNTSPAVSAYFGEYCVTADNEEEAVEAIRRLRFGPTDTDLERARAGADFVAQNHTWTHRINQLQQLLNL